MAEAFYRLPHTQTPSVSTLELSHETLEKIIRIDWRTDRDPVGRLQKVLEFVSTDERPGFNWKRVTRSLVGLRTRSKNGMYKYENAEASMQELKYEPEHKAIFDPALQRHIDHGNDRATPSA